MNPSRADRERSSAERSRLGPHAEVETRAIQGQPPAEIQHEAITRSARSQDDKVVLWMHGWAPEEAGRRNYHDRQAAIRRQAASLEPVPGD